MTTGRTKGWWVDKTVPALSSVLTPKIGIDPKAFAAWLGPKLGEYRTAMQERAELAQPKHNLSQIARDARNLAALLSDISSQAETRVDELAVKVDPGPILRIGDPQDDLVLKRTIAGESENGLVFYLPLKSANAGARRQFVSHMRRELQVLSVLANKIGGELQGRPGRKRVAARDKLLADVIDRLREHHGLKAAAARKVAEQVLILAGVATPAEESGIKKAVRRGKKVAATQR